MKKIDAKNNKVRKMLVRNSIIPARPSEVIREKKHVQFSDSIDEVTEPEEKNFSLPELCSILKLAEEIKRVQLEPILESKKLKECETAPRSYNLNFQPNEKLYQDLISLDAGNCDSQMKSRSCQISRTTLKKDPKPDLENCVEYTLQNEYMFTRFVMPDLEKPAPVFDGRAIYRVARTWEPDW